MQLTENEREYLKLVASARTNVWSPPESARRNIDEEELREAGIDEKYVKRPDRFHYSDDESNNKSIEEKVEEIPNRVESLIRDTELLYAAGYLDTEHWHADLNEVLPDQEIEEEANPPLNAQYGFEKPHKELGNRLGGLVTSLSSQSQANWDTVQFYKEVVEGFIYAIGYSMGCSRRIELYSELAEKMEESNEWASDFLEMPNVPEWRSELKEEILSCVKMRLQQEGYETPEEFVQSRQVDRWIKSRFL